MCDTFLVLNVEHKNLPDGRRCRTDNCSDMPDILENIEVGTLHHRCMHYQSRNKTTHYRSNLSQGVPLLRKVWKGTVACGLSTQFEYPRIPFSSNIVDIQLPKPPRMPIHKDGLMRHCCAMRTLRHQLGGCLYLLNLEALGK